MSEKEEKDIYINFGELTKGFGKLINLLTDMVSSGITEKELKGKILDTNIKDLHGTYGINIKIGADEQKPLNDKNFASKASYKKVVEPEVEIFEENSQILVIIELPDVDRDDIHYSIDNNYITIYAQNEKTLYKKKIPIKEKLINYSVKSDYNNGIFTITIKKAVDGGDADDGK